MTTIEKLNIIQYQSELLEPYKHLVMHGFTGRPYSFGGLSHSDNSAVDIQNNQRLLREQLAETCQSECADWVFPIQIHSADINIVGTDTVGECDALIITKPCQPVYIGTADCVPLILYSPQRHIGAVIHAGWRGTAQSIAAKTIEKLKTELDVLPHDIIAVIGPSISMNHYQVSLEVADALASSVDNTITELLQKQMMLKDDDSHYRVDLKQLNALQLQHEGCSNIEISVDCTRQNNNQYFSRRQGDPQNQIAFLMLR